MTGAPESSPVSAVRIERLLPAPIADVFAAWTNAEIMAHWFSPSGRAEVQADARVGGRFRVVMLDGSFRLEHIGTYLIVDPPYHLSFTWQSPYTGTRPSEVVIFLTARGTSTLLVLTHTRLPDETRRSHEGGWSAIVARVAGVLIHRTVTPSEKDGSQ